MIQAHLAAKISNLLPHSGSRTKLHSLQIQTQPTPRHQQRDMAGNPFPETASSWGETSSPLSVQKERENNYK